MSRHKLVRRMNYEDECYYDDDDYGHSYEDRYCISPSTAAEFTYNRDKNVDLSSYMEEEIPEEEEGDMEVQAQAAAPATGHDRLSEGDRGRLQSCVEEVHNVMGDSVGDAVLREAAVRNNFNVQATLNELLSLTDVPKPQRTPKKKRERTQGDDANIEDLLSEISALDQQDHSFCKGVGGRFRFQKGMSPPAGVKAPSSQISRGVVGVVKSSPVPVGGGSLPHSVRGSAHAEVVPGTGETGSDASPQQPASPPRTSLMALIQQQASERPDNERGSSPETRDSGLNTVCFDSSQMRPSPSGTQPVTVLALTQQGSKSGGQSPSDLIKARESSLPGAPRSVQENAHQAVGLSLSDLIRAQNSSHSASVRQISPDSLSSPHAPEEKPNPGLSLMELIAQNRQPSSVPLSLSSAVSCSSATSVASSSSTSSSLSSNFSTSPQVSKGLSLKELISLRSSHPTPDASVVKTSGQKEGDAGGANKTLHTTGLSLAQLSQARADSEGQAVIQAASSDIPPSSHRVQSASGGAASTTSSGAGIALAGGGLSLSELIKQHHSRGSKPRSPSPANRPSHDVSANAPPSKTSQLADQLQHVLSLKPAGSLAEAEERAPSSSKGAERGEPLVKDKEETALSLADCLKKKMTLHPEHSKPDPPSTESDSIELDEEDLPLPVQNIVDFEADCFDPMEVDPALRKAPSLLAQCIGLPVTERPYLENPAPISARRKVKFPKFRWSYQVRNRKGRVEVPLHVVAPFDFGTPSPDDIVKARQKAAFTRTGQKAS